MGLKVHKMLRLRAAATGCRGKQANSSREYVFNLTMDELAQILNEGGFWDASKDSTMNNRISICIFCLCATARW